jgi:hypothetical protein
LARIAVAAVRGIGSREKLRMRNEILLTPDAACHRATLFRACRHAQVFIRRFDPA